VDIGWDPDAPDGVSWYENEESKVVTQAWVGEGAAVGGCSLLDLAQAESYFWSHIAASLLKRRMVEKAVAEASRCAPGGNVEKNKDFMSSLWSQLSSGSWPRVHGLLHARLLLICVRQLCEEARAAVKADGGNGPLQFMHCDYSQSNSFEPAGVDEVTPTETYSVTEKMPVSRTPREHDSGLTVAWVAPDEDLC
jgi:hypothetical protein